MFAAIAFAIHSHCTCTASENQSGTKSEKLQNISSFRDIQGIFAPREVDVEILGMNPPGEFNRLQTAVIQSVRGNQSWFQKYVQANDSERPLPYHENFGITRDEYERFLELMKELKMVPVAKGRLRFSKKADDQILIEGIDGLHEFDGTVIDFKHGHVVTRWGITPLDRIVHVGEESAIGSWDGIRCRSETGSPETGTASRIRIDIGRQAATSLNFFCLSVRIIEDGVKTVNVETPVRFP